MQMITTYPQASWSKFCNVLRKEITNLAATAPAQTMGTYLALRMYRFE